jgi:uncharacterized protein YdhG (YjbR/CyaY superfamily)
MAGKRPTTIAEYIRAAPRESQPHLRRLNALLKSAAPKAKGVIKWGNPFYIEPRFLFAFSAHKAHVSFAPMAEAMQAFREDLKPYSSTKNFLRIPYGDPLPERLIRNMALHCVKQLRDRKDNAFW